MEQVNKTSMMQEVNSMADRINELANTYCKPVGEIQFYEAVDKPNWGDEQ